jgi:putative membrane protein
LVTWTFPAEDEAGEVRRGELAFALIVPSDLQLDALPGERRGGGELVVFVSEGNNLSTRSLATLPRNWDMTSMKT